MENTTYVTIGHMTALRRRMDLISNNMANMNTSGYKAEKPLFTSYLVDDQKIGERVAHVQDFGIVRNLDAGPLTPTGNPLDLGLASEGYFTVETDRGVRYTRNGNFAINPDGDVVTKEGFKLLDDGGLPLNIPEGATDIVISDNGSVAIDGVQLAQITPVTFDNERELERLPDSLYTTEQEPNPVERPSIKQGMIEGSNVVSMLELTDMIEVHRAYETSKNFVEREDERVRQALRKLSGAN